MMKRMKLLLTAAVLLLGLVAHAQNSVFDKYNDMRGVSSVYISKAMIDMQPDLYTKDVYIGKVAGQLDAIYIVSTMSNSIQKNIRTDIEQFIEKGKYELMMKQKGSTSRSAFYIKRKGDKVKELVMVSESPSTLRFIVLTGDLTLKDIQNITNYQHTGQAMTISEDGFCKNTVSANK